MTARGLEGITSLVTGAGAGIGRAIALRLAAEGSTVVVGDIDAAGAEQTVERVRSSGGTARHVLLDVADESSWRAVVDDVSIAGRLDFLVNNAGLPYRRLLPESTWTDWRRIMTVNAGGMFLGMKHAAPVMAESGGGSIVNVCSAAALVGVAGMTTYSASKGAIRAMSRAVASEYAAAGVRVNSVFPTSVPTAMLDSDAGDTGLPVDEFRRAAAALSPLPGLASTDDVAEAVLHLVGDGARFVTGSELVIDGGATSLIG